MWQRDKIGAFNERVKLRATSINAIGLAFAAVGAVQPIVESRQPDLDTLGWTVGALVLHAIANYIVSGVRKSA